MEEASVAGESPDRSKQRESSAEPTSGSASPVPEARSSTRDPRLAVARESISLGGVDTATRVFSVRDLPTTPEKPAEGPSEPATAGSDTGTPSPAEKRPEDAEGTKGPEDTPPPKPAPDASPTADDSGDADPADDPDTTDTPDGPEDSVTAESPGDTDPTEDPDTTDTPDGPEDSVTAESPGDTDPTEDPEDTAPPKTPDASATDGGSGDSDPAETADATDTTAGPDDSATAESADDSDAPDARLRDAVAAWVRTGDEKPGPQGKSAEPADDASADESAPDTDTATETDAADTAVADDEDHVPDNDKSDTPGARGTARPAPTDPRTDNKPNDRPHPDTDKSDTPEARGTARPAPTDPRTDNEPNDRPHPDNDKSDTPGARGTARPAPTDPRTDNEPNDRPRPDTGDSDSRPAPTGPQTDDEAPEDSRPDDADVSDTPPVDQPTAVFKAPRPPVDQPTTMLKLGKAADAPAAEPKDADEPRKPETAAERTSKFVALKALDEPRESRPKPDVTAAVPQVGQVGPERTTQQPLPPKPPLDLLAELTNTPPPPPSPLRTLGRRVKIWTPILILLVVAFAIAQSLRPLPAPTLSLTAEDSYTFDGSKATLPWPTQGQGWLDVNGVGTMGDFGKQTPVAIGSVAKAMTAYIVLKDHPLKSGEEGPKITVDALAEKEGGYNKQGESTLNTVKQGDVLTERQAIAAIMIPSANNIARLLARWDSGSEAAFIKKMNDTAEELGMKNTKYTDASGLKETTVSTAEDQVKLGNELVKIPALVEITSMGQWIDPSGQKWYNYNYLVPYTGIGIKTGTTTAAGGNLLFAGRKEVGGETVTVVGAILGQHKAPIIKTVNDVSKVALLAAEDALTSTKILKKGDVVGYVDDGLGGHTPVVLTKDVTAVGWAGFKVKLSFAADDVPHTAKAGTKVGSLTVGDGEGGAVKVPVTLQKDLTEPGFTDKLTRVG
ncbi:D-alanyl-D-alanine carboxypeptidase [Streptomyces sp. NPDC102405]|uniref:D-alanyl-D-alanine carboxypeptidase n=1 Tax=Streptomyces sp. NPDC102405 TaxID=3366170 RepID=UPI00380E2A3A